MLFMAWVFDGSGLMPVVLRMCLRYWISLVKKWHLLSFIDRCAFHNCMRTCLMCLRCSSAVLLKMIMSSRYAIDQEKSFKLPVINSWKYAGACVSPKGTLMYLCFTNGEVNAVLGIEDSSKGIWWYPAHRSNVKKYFAPFNWEKISSTFCMGQINFHVILLVHSSWWLDVSLHCPWEQLWWVLTSLIDSLILLSLAGACYFHPWPICSVSLLLGMAFVIMVQRFWYVLSSLLEMWF